jgi:hypothetical protein
MAPLRTSALTFSTKEDALRGANNTPYGLSAGARSDKIDDCLTAAGCAGALEDYTEEKTIQFHRGPRTGWWVG